MKKIKSFTHFDDSIINFFIDISKGKIVNYDPIVIEYDEKNLKEDPFKDYDIFKVPREYVIDGSYVDNKSDITNGKGYKNYYADTICIPKNGNISRIKLMRNGFLTLDNSDLSKYITVSFTNKKNPHFGSDLYFCVGGYFYRDYDILDSIEDLYQKLEDIGCKRMNYDSIFN